MRIKYHSSDPIVHYPEDLLQEGRWRDGTQARATNWEAPLWDSARIVLAGTILAIILAILLKEVNVAVYGTLFSLGIGALNLAGIFYLANRLISYLTAPSMDIDGNMDGSVSQQEVDEALHLFTPEGIAAFVKRWLYEEGDWV